MQIIPLETWYPAMAAKWSGRTVARSEREAWVVHHTAGGSGSSPLAYARQVANDHYAEWKVPGGYQALVGTDAVIREMCGLDRQGVHSGTHYWNRHGLGLAFQGDFRTNPPSDDMLAAGAEYMAQIVLPQTTHRAVRPSFTHCPGDALIALLPLEDDMPTAEEYAQAVWAFPVNRAGQQVKAIQELADIKTMLLTDVLNVDDSELKAAVDQLVARLNKLPDETRLAIKNAL